MMLPARIPGSSDCSQQGFSAVLKFPDDESEIKSEIVLWIPIFDVFKTF